MGGIFSKLVESLWAQKLEMAVIGLENAGKTTFVSQLVGKEWEKTVPTVGVNVERFKKGKLRLKLWDLGGQVQYRPEWAAYAKTWDMLVFVIDSSEPETVSFWK